MLLKVIRIPKSKSNLNVTIETSKFYEALKQYRHYPSKERTPSKEM
jgi:hypothetical protein